MQLHLIIRAMRIMTSSTVFFHRGVNLFQIKGITEVDEVDKYFEYVNDRPYNDQEYPLDTTYVIN